MQLVGVSVTHIPFRLIHDTSALVIVLGPSAPAEPRGQRGCPGWVAGTSGGGSQITARMVLDFKLL